MDGLGEHGGIMERERHAGAVLPVGTVGGEEVEAPVDEEA
jgi:hypothetical protein